MEPIVVNKKWSRLMKWSRSTTWSGNSRRPSTFRLIKKSTTDPESGCYVKDEREKGFANFLH
ncbi:hypothetical protein [Bhargavaea ullalensis]|uniref:hypothetical protein n=1 Tax=Bhargavaea ullalensis TaxID=1265685 RepID=UPI0033971D5A